MSGDGDDVRRLGKALFGLFVDGELPASDTPLFSNVRGMDDTEPPPPEPAPSVSTSTVTSAEPCVRCDGEREVVIKSVVVPCPACCGRK